MRGGVRGFLGSWGRWCTEGGGGEKGKERERDCRNTANAKSVCKSLCKQTTILVQTYVQ